MRLSAKIAKTALWSSLALSVALAMALFLARPARYAEAVLDGVSLWAANVLPAAFPFLFLTSLLTGLPPFSAAAGKLARPAGRVFRLSGAGAAAAILAALSGYPVGAKMVLGLAEDGTVGGEETFRLACLCSTSGPMFLVGSVGMMYGSAGAGWILLASHLLAVWTVCFLLGIGKTAPSVPPARRAPDRALLYHSVLQAVLSILCVGGLIALFAAFSRMASDLGIFRALSPLFGGNTAYAEGVLGGLLEMTTGCAALSRLKTPLSLACCCALATFGGMCVLCQQTAFLSQAGVRLLPFLGVKLLQAALAFLFCLALAPLAL